ncbi:MAG: outer membrane protein assembly factor BamB family protein [Thermoleophilia bacterium]
MKLLLSQAVFLVILAFAVSSCSTAQSPETNNVGEAFYRGDASRSGVYTAQEIIEPKGIRWKFQAGDRIFSTPAVVDQTVYFGSVNSNFYAVDINSGQEKWRKKTNGAVSSGPAVDNGIVYIGSFDGVLYALDANTGEERWRFETPPASVPPSDKRISNHGIDSSPVVVNGVVYFGTYGEDFYALKSTTGEKLWEFRADSPIFSAGAVDDGSVYFASLTSLYALDASTGVKKWSIQTGKNTMSNTPSVKGGLVFLDDVEFLHAFDIKNGKEKWSFKLGRQETSDCMVAVDQNSIFIGDRDAFYMIDANSGEKKWEFKPVMSSGAPGATATPPTISGNSVYFADLRGNIVSLDVKDGSVKWKYKYQKDLMQAPTPLTISDGVIYLGSMDGNLYAIEGGSSA